VVYGGGGVVGVYVVGFLVGGGGVGVGTEVEAEAVGEEVGAEEVDGVEGEGVGVDENYPPLISWWQGRAIRPLLVDYDTLDLLLPHHEPPTSHHFQYHPSGSLLNVLVSQLHIQLISK